MIRSMLVDGSKMLYLVRIGRPHILWSVNYLARAITEWSKVCGWRLARLISYIHCARVFVCIVTVNTQHHNAKLDCFMMTILQVIWKIQNQRQEQFCVFSEATRLFQLGGLVKNKLLNLTVVLKQKSYLWTLRVHGIPALGSRDVVIHVLEPQT